MERSDTRGSSHERRLHPGRGARNPCTPAGVQHSRYGNPGLRSLRSLNPGLNSQHASGVLRLTFQRRHHLADEPANRRRNLVFPLPLGLKNV